MLKRIVRWVFALIVAGLCMFALALTYEIFRAFVVQTLDRP